MGEIKDQAKHDAALAALTSGESTEQSKEKKAKVIEVAPAPEGATEMKVTAKRSAGFYANSACSFFRGIDARPAEDGKEAREAKPPVDNLRISGLGDAVGVAVTAAAKIVDEGLGAISKIQTAYPEMEGSGRGCPQIFIDLK